MDRIKELAKELNDRLPDENLDDYIVKYRNILESIITQDNYIYYTVRLLLSPPPLGSRNYTYPTLLKQRAPITYTYYIYLYPYPTPLLCIDEEFTNKLISIAEIIECENGESYKTSIIEIFKEGFNYLDGVEYYMSEMNKYRDSTINDFTYRFLSKFNETICLDKKIKLFSQYQRQIINWINSTSVDKLKYHIIHDIVFWVLLLLSIVLLIASVIFLIWLLTFNLSQLKLISILIAFALFIIILILMTIMSIYFGKGYLVIITLFLFSVIFIILGIVLLI